MLGVLPSEFEWQMLLLLLLLDRRCLLLLLLGWSLEILGQGGRTLVGDSQRRILRLALVLAAAVAAVAAIAVAAAVLAVAVAAAVAAARRPAVGSLVAGRRSRDVTFVFLVSVRR